MTEKLYDTDSYVKEFHAKLIDLIIEDGQCRAVLDRTAFFPEGGGQSGDHGWINGIPVMDVQEKDGLIYHYMGKGVPEEFKPGVTVSGKIDFPIRFSRMQQHSGEHIVSGIVHKMFGYENVGFHLGEENVTMDFNGEFSEEQLLEIEERANGVVFDNRPISVTFPSKEELRTMEYRSKIEISGQVRLVTIPDCDVCACCAPPVGYTGEIGLIKLVEMNRHRGGVRVIMVAGERALSDYRMKERNTHAISVSLSVPVNHVAERVETLKEENLVLKTQIAELQKKQLSAKVSEVKENSPLIMLFEDGMEGSLPRELMNQILNKNVIIAAVFAGNDKAGYRYVVGSRQADVREIAKTLNQKFSGRGGGKTEMVQGSIHGTESEIKSAMLQQLQGS